MNRLSGVTWYSPSPISVVIAGTGLPWPWSGIQGLTSKAMPVIGWPLLMSSTIKTQVLSPRTGDAGLASAIVTASCLPIFSRPTDHGSARVSLAQNEYTPPELPLPELSPPEPPLAGSDPGSHPSTTVSRPGASSRRCDGARMVMAGHSIGGRGGNVTCCRLVWPVRHRNSASDGHRTALNSGGGGAESAGARVGRGTPSDRRGQRRPRALRVGPPVTGRVPMIYQGS